MEKDAVEIVRVATKWLLTREIYEPSTAFLGGVLYLSDVDCKKSGGAKSPFEEKPSLRSPECDLNLSATCICR